MVINEKSYCHYFINYKYGTVDMSDQPKDDYTIYIGGHTTPSAHHAIGSFEMYQRVGDAEPLSDKFTKCLIKDILKRINL